MLRLKPQQGGDNGVERFKLDLDKANYGGTIWSLTLERRQDSYIFTPVDIEASVTPKEIWEMLGSDGAWLEKTKADIVARFSVAEATARRAIEKAERQHILVRERRTNPETRKPKNYLIRGNRKAE